MARNKTKKQNTDLPGSFYQRNSRWWWKVQLPGEKKAKNRPLHPIGAKYAATDYSVACEVARNLWQQAVYRQNPKDTQIAVSNIASLIAAYLKHCDEYYLDENGKPTKEVQEVRYTLKPMTEVFAALGVKDFGPLRLIEVRDRMIGLDWSRNMINQRMGRIKRMFKWAVSRQMISPVVYHGLMTVEGLKRGRSAAKETPKRRPVKEQYIYAVLAHTTPVVAAMIELNVLTGMRPGELVIMRPADIDRSDEAVWHYYPEKHKNQYRNIDRVISIGPRGQELLGRICCGWKRRTVFHRRNRRRCGWRNSTLNARLRSAFLKTRIICVIYSHNNWYIKQGQTKPSFPVYSK